MRLNDLFTASLERCIKCSLCDICVSQYEADIWASWAVSCLRPCRSVIGYRPCLQQLSFEQLSECVCGHYCCTHHQLCCARVLDQINNAAAHPFHRHRSPITPVDQHKLEIWICTAYQPQALSSRQHPSCPWMPVHAFAIAAVMKCPGPMPDLMR